MKRPNAEGGGPKRRKTADGPVREALAERLSTTKVLSDFDGAFIATHHGTFHADEVMACVMLKLLPEFAELPIVRTRDAKVIDRAAIAVDVGGTYETDKHRYDHHQATFTTTYAEKYEGFKLSSAGLVFKHFGARVVRAICRADEPGGPTDAQVEKLVAKVYGSLILELDALDNGVMVAEKPKYGICTHLGARIRRCNGSWQDPTGPEVENARFSSALALATEELFAVVAGYADEWLPARSIVEAALQSAKSVHPSGQVLMLDQFCPWQEHLFDLEQEGLGDGSAKYMLFADSRGSWRVQAVPAARGSFENRKQLPKVWCGVRDQALSDLSGIPGCIFVHANGFIGGNATEEGARAMATKALDM